MRRLVSRPSRSVDVDNCTVDAFVACGGRADKTGHVLRDTLVRIIKHDFGLTIDIEACLFSVLFSIQLLLDVRGWLDQELINKVDKNGSGEIEYEEFKTLLS